ncbi:hypothetical protein ASD11_15015 [Aeromicrobium sp. Root495]|uniref:CU044_5270 family protein n=1 Tax=Aeromicrobium sp. Root495 TaxID=1736550 RepID=UPI0006FA3220|nr:CU044_5270 family protein [Aeromicrobium sp. Root495]KQY55812.1 hypothetical protein ASD11_15015 [Aeromicrobium sp. Root495]
MTSPDKDADDALELFRREAEELGFGSGDLGDLAAQLESPDDFIARMKRQDREREEQEQDLAPPRPLRRRRRAVLVAVGTAAASAALVFGIARPGGSPAAADAPPVLDFEFAAATRIAYAPGKNPTPILKLLSDAADGASPSIPGAGTIQYKKTDNWYADQDDNGTSKIVPRVSETWLRPDGSLTTKEFVGQALRADGRGVLPGRGKQLVNETLEAGSVDAGFARSLPTDPAALASALVAHGQCESTTKGDVRSLCLYRQVVELTQTYVLPASLTAALWQMLDGEAGFRTLGSVEDRAGRDAVAISLVSSDEPEIRHLLFGSLDDGQILGYEEILIKTDPDLDVKPPSVLSFSTSLDSRLTESAPE